MQIEAFVELYQRRELLLAWTLRTVRARYQQSILGGLWAVFQPAATAIVFTIIFTRFIPIDTDGIPYVVFSFSAMVPWTLFSTSVSDMVDALVINMNLISKIYFPREILVIAAMLARLLDFVIAFGVLVLLMTAYDLPVLNLSWLYLPLVLFIQLCLSLGIGLAGAALNVFSRDIKHFVTLGLQLWFYATPIIYPVSMVPENLQPFYFLNPMAGIIVAYRSILLYAMPPGTYLVTSAVIALTILILGYWLFKRVALKFADII